MTPENQSNIIISATFLSNFCAHLGSSPARIIHATITSIKHTTKVTDITIFVNIHTIYGKAFVGLIDHSHFILIQFHIIGKSVLSLIPQHQFGHESWVCVLVGVVLVDVVPEDDVVEVHHQPHIFPHSVFISLHLDQADELPLKSESLEPTQNISCCHSHAFTYVKQYHQMNNANNQTSK